MAIESDAATKVDPKSGGPDASLYGPAPRHWLAHLFAAVMMALTVALGTWQVQRAEQKATAQAGRDQALAAAPRMLDAGTLRAAAAEPDVGARLDGARVAVRGRFDPDRTILLDNRTRAGVAGFHVLAPLRVDGMDAAVMVLRGWVPADPRDRMRAPPVVTPSGAVEVEGLAMRELQQPLMLGSEEGNGPIWQHFKPSRFEHWAGYPAAALLVRQTTEPAYRDELARDWNQPGVGVDRHRAYALQWFTMAAVVAIGWVFLVLRGRASPGSPGRDGDSHGR